MLGLRWNKRVEIGLALGSLAEVVKGAFMHRKHH